MRVVAMAVVVAMAAAGEQEEAAVQTQEGARVLRGGGSGGGGDGGGGAHPRVCRVQGQGSGRVGERREAGGPEHHVRQDDSAAHPDSAAPQHNGAQPQPRGLLLHQRHLAALLRRRRGGPRRHPRRPHGRPPHRHAGGDAERASRQVPHRLQLLQRLRCRSDSGVGNNKSKWTCERLKHLQAPCCLQFLVQHVGVHCQCNHGQFSLQIHSSPLVSESLITQTPSLLPKPLATTREQCQLGHFCLLGHPDLDTFLSIWTCFCQILVNLDVSLWTTFRALAL